MNEMDRFATLLHGNSLVSNPGYDRSRFPLENMRDQKVLQIHVTQQRIDYQLHPLRSEQMEESLSKENLLLTQLVEWKYRVLQPPISKVSQQSSKQMARKANQYVQRMETNLRERQGLN